MTYPPVLIEDWLPIEAIGAESKRERGASSALPPLYFLHVWWARRPLTTSRAAILGSVMPQWSADWPDKFKKKFPTREAYQNWFIYLTGIRGDPAEGRKLVDWAKAKGIKLDFHPYGGAPRAFTVNPDVNDLETMADLLEYTWGHRDLSVLDPFAGGGSIPFEALRYGFTTFANDLNPVAAVILKATLDYPVRFGLSLGDDIKQWGDIWANRVEEKLAPYFPKQVGENIFAYLYARTVDCPTTGKPVPLSPNWWLNKSPETAVKMIAEPEMTTPHFEVVTGKAARTVQPDTGTISRGVGRSPWTGEIIEADYIKAEARAGRMGAILFSIVTKHPGKGFEVRVPTFEDYEAAKQAEITLNQKMFEWQIADLLPTEPRRAGRADWAAELYGIRTWSDTYAPRHKLAMGTALETLNEIKDEIYQSYNQTYAEAIITYLSLAFDKAADYNSTQVVWDVTRRKIAHAFQRHDFAFKWTYAEFDAAGNLIPWVVGQIVDAYSGIAKLATPSNPSLWQKNTSSPIERLQILRDTATRLDRISSESVHSICVDPPYYDNVQYAELSDYFYVWLKRTLGDIFENWFDTELTNKDEEAIASPERFASFGKKRKRLAEQDYERKMASAFREMHRVLRPDGVLTVMFTHKRVEAWDTLTSALIGAGFTIKASWPVHTESEHSLHQAKKNAAASTILLVCRKREVGEPEGGGAGEPVWWDDIQGQVREMARNKAREYVEQGISGVDLYISTFGPTLSLISEKWPVLTSEIDPKTNQPRPLRPETALDLARVEVIRLRKEGLLAGRDVQFDPVTDWYLMAWDAFQAEQFPFDEARKLAIALGLEVDHLLKTKRLVAKKGQYVVLQQPGQRRKRGMVDPDAAFFENWIDALHTAMLIYQEDGAGACDVFLLNRGLKRDSTFRAGLQAMINAIPRTQIKGEFIRPEADVLDKIRLAFYVDELTVPVEEEPELPQVEQLKMAWDEEVEEEEEIDEEGE